MASLVSNANNVICERCNKPLGLVVSEADNCRLYHPECMTCYNCRVDLNACWFFVQKKSLFCVGCFNLMYRPRCAECCKPIKADGKGIKAMNVKLHQKCFRCKQCDMELTNDYYVFNRKHFCYDCYQMHRENAVAEVEPSVSRRVYDPNIMTARHTSESDIIGF